MFSLRRAEFRSLVFAIFSVGVIGANFTPRCGDCWCGLGDVVTTCPEYPEEGIGEIPKDFGPEYEILASFQLTSTQPDLLAEDGTDNCFPYADQLGAGTILPARFPESDAPQCAFPPLSELNSPENGSAGAVCAYKYENGTECMGRKYEMISYESAEAAWMDNATITHWDACGVCSTAQDLWARIDNPELDTKVTVCAISYFLAGSNSNTRFEELVDCIQELGFTRPCARLWSFSSASNSALCAEPCLPVENVPAVFNLDPPTCAYATCLECGEQFGPSNRRMGGRITMETSGITEAAALPCSHFSRVVHDPCVGATTSLDSENNTDGDGTGGSDGDTNGGTSGNSGIFAFERTIFASAVALAILFA